MTSPLAVASPRATYLDWASTAPLHPAARAALLAAWDEGWADPSRLYREARRARQLLDLARQSVAEALDARADEVFFPHTGTEAAHLAVLGTLSARGRVGRRLVTSPVEHSCVLHAGELHETGGGTTELLAVDHTGRVIVPDRLPTDTALVSVQSGNQEIGTLQPVADLAGLCGTVDIPLHVDATQSVGRVPVSREALGADLLTASGHKFGGPPGVGLLVVRTGTRWRSPSPTDERGAGRVPGFENVPSIVATAAALQARRSEIDAEATRLAGYVERLRTGLPGRVPDVEIVGPSDPAARLPHLLSASFLYVDGERLVGALDEAGFAISSGSACTASSVTPSHVLEAIGALTHGNVRISVGRDTTADDVERLLATVPEVVSALRADAGVGGL
ncbi:MAG TPA: cysteine desulfurase family protein [Frankiaceae bacterium]|nr:cysteine desulfurase family protein [Frankiaceae bacterium]